MPTVNGNIHNRFDIEVIDAKSGEIRQRAQAENIILDALWTKLLSASPAYNQYIHYGTGSGTPTANRTQLFTFLGSKQPAEEDDYYDINYTVGTLSVRRKIVLSENEHVGATLTEVGIAYGTSASNLVTHAMLKDMNGNTVTILKTATDIINIYATVFVHVNPNGYANGKIKVPLKPNNFFLRAYLTGTGEYANQGTFCTAALTGGAHFDVPTYDKENYGVSFARPKVTQTFDVPNKKIIVTANRVGAAEGNNQYGIKAIVFESAHGASVDPSWSYPQQCAVTVDFDAVVPGGTTVSGESVGTGDGVTKDFTTKFPFAKNATVFINGVQTAATVDAAPANTDMGMHFELIPEKSSLSWTDRGIIPTPITAQASYQSVVRIGDYAVYYNPYWQYGIRSFSSDSCAVYASDDAENWVLISGTTVPAEHRTKKYWKIECKSIYSGETNSFACYKLTADTLTGKNIHFATPPASGAVITADYTTETIAKDENHVFDCSITIQLGELIV